MKERARGKEEKIKERPSTCTSGVKWLIKTRVWKISWPFNINDRPLFIKLYI